MNNREKAIHDLMNRGISQEQAEKAVANLLGESAEVVHQQAPEMTKDTPDVCAIVEQFDRACSNVISIFDDATFDMSQREHVYNKLMLTLLKFEERFSVGAPQEQTETTSTQTNETDPA